MLLQLCNSERIFAKGGRMTRKILLPLRVRFSDSYSVNENGAVDVHNCCFIHKYPV